MRIHLRASRRTFVAGGFAIFGAFLGAGGIASYLTGSARPLQAETPASTQPASRPEKRPASAPASAETNVVLASPGRIEARSDTVEVGAAIDGVIQTVYVNEGQAVS